MVATPRARPSAASSASDHGAVVGAVAGRLDDDVAVEAEEVAQREQLLLAGVDRRVLALRRVGEDVAGAEHVAVGVDRAGRRDVGRLAGVRVEREPVGVGRERGSHPQLQSSCAQGVVETRVDPAGVALSRPAPRRPRPGRARRRTAWCRRSSARSRGRCRGPRRPSPTPNRMLSTSMTSKQQVDAGLVVDAGVEEDVLHDVLAQRRLASACRRARGSGPSGRAPHRRRAGSPAAGPGSRRTGRPG